MNLKNKRRVAAGIFKSGKKRVWFNFDRREDIKKAITKTDIRDLIKQGAVAVKHVKGVSRARARKAAVQKRKGRMSGKGSRKGKRTSRLPRKKMWIIKVRVQREFLILLKSKGLIGTRVYRDLRQKVKGGFFRSRRHMKLYIDDRGLTNGKK